MKKSKQQYLSYIEETPKHYSKLKSAAKKGVKKSLINAKEKGLYITYSLEGVIVREYPDGTIEQVGRIDKEDSKVEIGAKFELP